MMEGQNGSDLPKTKENGLKGKPPYSVETPYGFRIDLDFLKYVDDIEKGNTIKRVPIHRRSKGTRASTLPRHLNTNGCGYRPSPWGSTGALGPRSRLSEGHHHGSTSWANGHRSRLSPTGLQSLTEMEARIKEFDEQPLGEHIRPHLLRASSLPLTVLLRQGSESTDDTPCSLRSSRDHLGGRNISCEDVSMFPESLQSQDCSGLLRRLREALERVRELETEVRVVPELRTQICILKEESERLRLGLDPHTPSLSVNGTAAKHTSSHYGTVGVKSQRVFPTNHSISHEDSNPTHEWRTSTDLDELLTVTSLQAKLATLEQKLHETGLELQRALKQLREQQDESSKKDGKIEYLIRTPGVWVQAERVVLDQDGDETLAKSIEPSDKVSEGPDAFISARTVATNGQGSQQQDSVAESKERSPQMSVAPVNIRDDSVVVGHIKRIKSLLDQQWECLCADHQAGEEGHPPQHPDPRVNSLQQETMGLLDTLVSYYTQHGHGGGEMIQHEDECARPSTFLRSGGDNDGYTNKSGNVDDEEQCENQSEEMDGSSILREMAAAQVDSTPGGRLTGSGGQMISGGAGSVRTDGDAVSEEAEAPEKTAKLKPQPSGEQMGSSSGSESTTGSRETVSPDFMAACQFLKDHMDNMDNPNDDMRKALIVVFQRWFGVAAEEASVASELAAYLREVRKATPSLLAFLVNLADDNGNTVLHYSVSHCNYPIVSLILDTAVSDVNVQNNAGYTAVMLASLTAPEGPGGMEVVRRLMEMGSIHTRSQQTGQTALHLAVRHGRVVMVRLLLSYGADTNTQDNQGTTALMFASERGHTHVARLLLERSQCDLTLTDKRGRTALSIAMQGSHTDTAALLQAHAKARAL